MKVTGKIKVIFETQTWDSGFTKREFVVTTNETYPQDIKIELVKDKCSLLDLFNVGQDVEVSINLRGNEYNGKYYVTVQGWKIDKTESSNLETAKATAQAVGYEYELEDDLPF